MIHVVLRYCLASTASPPRPPEAAAAATQRLFARGPADRRAAASTATAAAARSRADALGCARRRAVPNRVAGTALLRAAGAGPAGEPQPDIIGREPAARTGARAGAGVGREPGVYAGWGVLR